MNSVNTWTTTQHFWLIIFGFFVAFLPRYIPLLVFTKRKIPDWFNEWMKYVPVSLFTALVVKDVFIDANYHLAPMTHLPELAASLIVIVIAYRTRSMAISVILGLISVFLLAMVI
ncbi:branched-chain amino acid transporter [Secundilactobacillus oryzae JCM 18671]|uniref:Branched-chain amino acid transporter n=1 Tax=Secundilactobacillus oryzae JCM 18671 TaxID=1291743 RepID=A0A081BHW0_9LACO|nr:AzlD domain-containing protein [Secundilactobacillus oryzae]GAK47628.1 branched-chain amino acid transporter [Secundilactobacillus oryzae JCM 18671]